MRKAFTNSRTRRALNLSLIGVFALLLWLPTIDTFSHLDHAPAFNEKRVLAPFPNLKQGIRNVGEYAKGLEAYFNDHFGWRRQLIHWHVLAEISVFKTKSSKGVVVGKNGWLFYAPANKESGGETGPFSQQGLN